MTIKNRDVAAAEPNLNKVGWRVNEFAADAGISRSLVYMKISEGVIDSVKLGAARIITTSPSDFIASLAKAAGAPRRGEQPESGEQPAAA
jgi:hypothetical protein